MKLTEFITQWNEGINWIEEGEWDNGILEMMGDDVVADFAKVYGVQPRRPLGISQLYKPVVLHLLDSFDIYEFRTASLSSKFHLWLGNSIEAMLLCLLQHYGVDVHSFQKEVEYSGVPGHIDCIYRDNTVIDIKSMKYSYFSKWKEGTPDDSKGYVTQLLCYREAAGLKNAGLLALNKQSGELGYFPVESDMLIETDNGIVPANYALKRVKKILEILDSEDIENLEDTLRYIPEPSKQPLGKFAVVPSTMQWDSRRYCFWDVDSVNKIKKTYDKDLVITKLLAYKRGESV